MFLVSFSSVPSSCMKVQLSLMNHRAKQALGLFLLLSLQRSGAQLKSCYYYDGSPAPDFPCDPEAEVGSESFLACRGITDSLL